MIEDRFNHKINQIDIISSINFYYNDILYIPLDIEDENNNEIID